MLFRSKKRGEEKRRETPLTPQKTGGQKPDPLLKNRVVSEKAKPDLKNLIQTWPEDPERITQEQFEENRKRLLGQGAEIEKRKAKGEEKKNALS